MSQVWWPVRCRCPTKTSLPGASVCRGTAQLALAFGQATADGAGSDYHLHNATWVHLPEGRNFSIRQGSNGTVRDFHVVTRMTPNGVPGAISYQEINNNTAGLYALGADLAANPGTEETPLGGWTGTFTGQFHGLGHSITGLKIKFTEVDMNGPPGRRGVGMFSTLDVGAVARDFGLLGGIRDSASLDRGNLASYVGAVAGFNNGLIHKVHTTTNVYGVYPSALGGLVGQNTGTIRQSMVLAWTAASFRDRIESRMGALVGINLGLVEDSVALVSQFPVANAAIGDNSRGQANRIYITEPGYQVTDNNTTRVLDDAAMKSASTFAGWDIGTDPDGDSIWRIHEGSSTPLLRDMRRRVVVDEHVTYDGQVHSDGPVSGRNAGVYAAAVDMTPLGQEVTGALVIDPAALTVSSSDVIREYDGTTDALRAQATVVSGRLFGADSLGGGRFVFADANAGTGKTVLVSDVTVVDGNGGANYALTLVDNTSSTITAAPLQIRVDPTSKTYDGSTQASATWRLSGGRLFGSDALVSAMFQFDNANAGTGKPLLLANAVFDDGNGGANYALTLAANAAGSIAPAELVVTAHNDQRVAGGQPYQGGNGFTTRGWVVGEDDRWLQSGVVYGGTAQGAVAAGSYSIVPGGLSSPNYRMLFENGTLVISALPPADVEPPVFPPAQVLPMVPGLPALPRLPDQGGRAKDRAAAATAASIALVACGMRLPTGLLVDDCR